MKKLLALLTLVFCFNCYSQKWEYAEYRPMQITSLEKRAYAIFMIDTTIFATVANDAAKKPTDIAKFKAQWNLKMPRYIKLTDEHSISDLNMINYFGMNGWECFAVNEIRTENTTGFSYYFKRQVK